MDKTTAIGAATIAAAAVTAGISAAIPNTTTIEGSYSIREVNPYQAEVRVTVPEEFTPDIVALKMNDMEVAKTILPQGYIATYPMVVSDTDRLSMDMYVRGEEAATAEFAADGRLVITVNDKYIKSREPEETEEVITDVE